MKSRTTVLLVGGIAGALLGLLVAWILVDDEREGTDVGPGGASGNKIRPGEAVSLAVAAIGIVRQIATLRQR